MSSQPSQSTDAEAGVATSSDEDRRALEEKFGVLYNQIRGLAGRLRWHGSNPTLNATALAHEAYLKLLKNPGSVASKPYEEVIGIFSSAMHQILIDAARRKNSQKRIFAESPDTPNLPIEEVITIGAALEQLTLENPIQAQIVRCRFFLGLSVDETATAVGLARRTVEREWQDARQRLRCKIDPTAE